MSEGISFKSDKVKLSGPKIDGSYVVSLEVGQYELGKIKDLVTWSDAVIEVSLKRV